MARANKKEVLKKETAVKETAGITGIKEESEKGEMFFKVILIIMAVALFAVVLYFVVDTLIGDNVNQTTKKYHANNYITVTQIDQINTGENFENITHLGLREALDNYAYVYIFFFADLSTAGLSETTINRQNQALAVVDQLMDLDIATERTVANGTTDGFIYITLGDDVAIFFLDISEAANATWASTIDTSAGQAASAGVPALLEIHNGEELEWFGPWTAVDKNDSALTKLNELLEGLQ